MDLVLGYCSKFSIKFSVSL